MKKKYITPEVEVVKLNSCTLLAGSATGSNVYDDAPNNEPGLSRGYSIFDDGYY